MPLIRSWVESANSPETPFPLNNLPYGAFLAEAHPDLGEGVLPHCAVAIGTFMLDVTTMEGLGKLRVGEDVGLVFTMGDWTTFLSLEPQIWASFRQKLMALLAEGSTGQSACEPFLVQQKGADLVMPFRVAEFTDFYSGRHHAENVGTMFRGAQNALPPNWLHMPIGYNGRASSVVVSGTPVIRPHGQIMGQDYETPDLQPSRRFDLELEMGTIVGQPSDGPISVAQAFENIFGYVLLNDWSARDVQAWEYQPLGPFQAKATATTVSPWIVTAEALEPFRVSTPERTLPLLPYLKEPAPMLYDIALEIGLTPENGPETTIARTNFREMYYSPAQQLAHHTSSGCPMRVGDLLGSGTISGPQKHMRGSMLELTWGGTEPIELFNGRVRSFLEDGDTVTLRGHAQGDGYRIGFGECAGTVKPARG